MPTNTEQIRALIERWADAVHRGDLANVLADHADDIVMFDVPPPYRGVRGLDAYGAAWPSFFEWQADGAVFEIESLEVTAGDDVAFAHALLRCGNEKTIAENPASRLRLTVGLRKQDGRWLVTHEHHSFALAEATSAQPAIDQDRAAAEQDLRRLHERWFDSTAAKDLDGLMAPIANDVISYEHEHPLQYVGVQAVREVCRAGLDTPGGGSVTWNVPDLKIVVDGDLAVAWGLNLVELKPVNAPVSSIWSRGTRVFQRTRGAWQLIHQHLSYPYDPTTGNAKTDLRPDPVGEH